jgi:hypothetical protein
MFVGLLMVVGLSNGTDAGMRLPRRTEASLLRQYTILTGHMQQTWTSWARFCVTNSWSSIRVICSATCGERYVLRDADLECRGVS